MNWDIHAGDTSKTIYLKLRDSTTGLAKTGLAFGSAGAVCSYTLPLAARVAITLATQTVTAAWTTGGFVEVDATNCKGLYRLDLPNAAIASGAFSIISIEFDGTIEESVEIELATRDANVVQWNGSGISLPVTAGIPEVNVKNWNNLTTVALPLIPTVAGRTLDVSATGEAGLDWANVGSPTTTVGLSGTTIAVTQIVASISGNVDGNVTGTVASVVGAVGSVTGAVGSVAGNVDGNVTGTVASVVTKTGYELLATGADLILKGSTFALALADSVWDEILTGATHNVATSAGKRLRLVDAAFEVHSGTARVTSTSTTIDLELATADNTTDDIYAGDRCIIVAGTGIGEHGLILSYNSTTQVATMSKAWVITPDATSEYVLAPADCDVELWNDTSVTGDGDWAALQTATDAIKVITDALGATAAANLALMFAGALVGIVDDATLAISSTVFEVLTLAETGDGEYDDQALFFTSGTNIGRTFFVTASEGVTANPNNKVKLTVQAMPTSAVDGDTFILLGTKGQ